MMRSYTQRLLRGLFLFGFVACFGIWQHHDNNWNYLVFTQQWPIAACVDINDTKGHTCQMPQGVSGWTIHGIWPSNMHGGSPSYCNNSDPFIEDRVKDLIPVLTVKWPNLVKDSEKTAFWKHEWTKHGTCARSLQELDTEHKYFNKALELNQQFSFMTVLSKNNIVPSSTKGYSLDSIRKAIESFTNKTVRLQCIFSKDQPRRQALIQVELCVNKQFETIDCEDYVEVKDYKLKWEDPIPYNPSYEPCSRKYDVQYLPFSDETNSSD